MRFGMLCRFGVCLCFLSAAAAPAWLQSVNTGEPAAQGQLATAKPQLPSVIHTLAAPAFRHGDALFAVAVAKNGKQLLTGGDEGINLWDIETGKHLKKFSTDNLTMVLRLAVGGESVAAMALPWKGEKQVAVYDLGSGKARFTTYKHNVWARMAVSPDGSTLACAGDSVIRLWGASADVPMLESQGPKQFLNAPTGKLIAELKGHTDQVNDVVFCPDGKTLISVSEDGTMRQWNAATGKESRPLVELPGWRGHALAVSGDGKTIALVAYSGDIATKENPISQLRLLDPITLKERFRATLPGVLPNSVAVSRDGRYVSAGCTWMRLKDNYLYLWDTWTCKRMRLDPGNDRVAFSVCFLLGSKTLVSVDDAGAMRFWNVADGVEHDRTKGPAGEQRLAFSATGTVLACAYSDGTVELWDSAKGVLLHHLLKRQMSIDSPVFSPDAGLVFYRAVEFDSNKGPCSGFLLNARTGECLLIVPTEFGAAATFAPSGKTLAIADHADVVLWDVAQRTELRRLKGDDYHFLLAFSPDDRLLATACRDKTLRLWNVATGICLRTLADDLPMGARRLWFSPDGLLLFVHCKDRPDKVYVFDTITCESLVTLSTGDAIEQGFCLTHGGATLVVSSGPGKFRAIDLFTGKSFGLEVEYGGDFTSAELTPDGHMLALAYKDGRLLLCKPPPLPPRQPLAGDIDQLKLEELWQAQAGSDSQLAFQARWQLAATPKQTLPLLRAQLQPATPPDAKQIAVWIAQLDSTSYKERQVAMHGLEKIGYAVGRALCEVLEHKPTLEMRQRIELLLTKLAAPPSGETLRALRAIGILEAIGGDEARAILRSLAGGAPGFRITEAAEAALKRME